MELDAKDSEIESLRRTIANFNSETASLSSGPDNDIDELGQWLNIYISALLITSHIGENSVVVVQTYKFTIYWTNWEAKPKVENIMQHLVRKNV